MIRGDMPMWIWILILVIVLFALWWFFLGGEPKEYY